MIKPILDNILIEPEEEKTQTESGILLTEVKKDVDVAKVLAIGEGRTNEKGTTIKITSVKVGDRIIYNGLAAQEAGDNLLIINEEDIIAVYEKKNKLS